MKFFKKIRLLLAFIIFVFSIFYIVLANGKRDASPFIVTSRTNPGIILTGDYSGYITLKNDSIFIAESLVFLKNSLEQIIKNTSYGAHTWGSNDTPQIKAEIKDYLDRLTVIGWFESNSPPEKISLKKQHKIPMNIGLFDKTKRFPVPVLFTDGSEILDKKNNDDYDVTINDSVKRIKYAGILDYALSKRSKILVIAKEGLVQQIFPNVPKENLVDKNNNEIYYLDSTVIGTSFIDHDIISNTINIEVLNPIYNNSIGNIIKDWSIGKIIAWAIVTLVALFADKIKEIVFKPIVDRIYLKKRKH